MRGRNNSLNDKFMEENALIELINVGERNLKCLIEVKGSGHAIHLYKQSVVVHSIKELINK